METLSSSNPSIFISAPEPDTTYPVIDEDQKSDRTPALQPESVSNATLPAYVADSESLRYARDFTDPIFPCKTVSYRVSKRVFDTLFAMTMLILASPIMIVAAILVKATSKGPVLFKQTRVGRGGRYFWCYKFRSMCVDAEARRQTLMHLNEASGPVFKIKRDPRVTRVGAFLRKFSIDELPQLFNVINGDMSIVGPRPPLPCEVDHYTPHQRGRLAVQPGLTCLWQVGGRSSIGFERWVEMDLTYIDKMSFFSDIQIILQTIPAVIRGSGAH